MRVCVLSVQPKTHANNKTTTKTKQKKKYQVRERERKRTTVSDAEAAVCERDDLLNMRIHEHITVHTRLLLAGLPSPLPPPLSVCLSVCLVYVPSAQLTNIF